MGVFPFEQLAADRPRPEAVEEWAARLTDHLPAAHRSPREALLDRALEDPELRADLFRFVDALPSCHGDADVHAHLREYVGARGPWWVRGGTAAADVVPGGEHLAAHVASGQVRAMAARFIAAEDARGAVPVIGRLWQDGFASTVDLLGERTLTRADADRYVDRVTEMLTALATAARSWPSRPDLEHDAHGPTGRVHLSIKPTALAPHLAPTSGGLGLAEAAARLQPLIARAADVDATVGLDMEQYDVKDLTVELVERLWLVNRKVRLGAVVQAYTRTAEDDIAAYAQLARALRIDHGAGFRPLQVRLVKGAYWDAETAQAQAQGWVPPVWQDKARTDRNYERCVDLLLAHADVLRPAFASHNVHSLAYALAATEAAGLPLSAVEVQVLRGMGERIAAAVSGVGVRVRVYCPVGELVPGMGYLVRRLLENTSNQSFAGLVSADERPASIDVRERAAALGDGDDDEPELRTAVADGHGFVNEATAEWRRAHVRETFVDAVRAAANADPVECPAIVDGRDRRAATTFESVDPARHDHVVAHATASDRALTTEAVEVVAGAQPSWAARGWAARADVLDRWGDAIAADRVRLSALIAVEVGKPVPEADVEVCEAIDFCRYYAARARAMAEGAPLISVAGERNRFGYVPRGVAAVVSPWNFPLSIPCGMTAAALVTGNGVVLKPAEQAPLVARELVRLAHGAGVDPGVLAYLPGDGPTTGAAVVAHPQVASIAFTGSRAVGLALMQGAAADVPGRRDLVRVVAELGGKNAVVVGADADLDVVVPALVSSAFGFAGQKCSAASRLIAVGAIAEPLIERLAGATQLVTTGPVTDLATTCGPVIEPDSVDRYAGVMDEVAAVGRVVAVCSDAPSGGGFVAPAVVEVPTDSRVWTDELFVPVLAVTSVPDLDTALEVANASPYALTAGYFGRLPSDLARAAEGLRAGNVYVNRPITGAVVGRQPFGGRGLSGVGSKAGGPDYLAQFCDQRVVSENTMRQGFAPELL